MFSSGRARNACWATAVVAILAFFSLEAFAKPVGKEEAATAVKGWLKLLGRGLGAALGNGVKETQVYTDRAGSPLYYVVYLQPSGFVIVPADDLVEPIICFSAAGTYVASDDNPLGALVTRDIPGRLALVRGRERAALPAKAITDAQGKWEKLRSPAAAGPGELGLSSVSDPRVDPLVQSTWSQGSVAGGYCYNYYTPNHYVCGCGPTAMAQLMRFHQWPTAGVGTGSFTITVDGTPTTAQLRGGNGSGGPYDWANMVLAPGSGITDAQRQAIGALCYDAGVATNTHYASGGSTTGVLLVPIALKNTFKYSNAVISAGYLGVGPGFNGMANPNLDAGLPILISIYGSAGAHGIVGDGYGYDTGSLYHHVNMGSGGSSDAWYNLPNISSSFTGLNRCVYNVYVAGSGEIISGRVTDATGLPISGVTVTAKCGAGATYTAITNTRGIYALAKVPSASSFIVTAYKPGYEFAPRNAFTGTSSGYATTSGNVWGLDITVAATCYKLEGWGGVHPSGGAPTFSGGPYWPGWDIANDLAVVSDSTGDVKGYYVLDGYGGVWPVGNVPWFPGGPYWGGWDIARALKVVYDSSGTVKGYYVLDGFGGVHRVGNVPALAGGPYWAGWDIARDFDVVFDSNGNVKGYYVLDGFGGVHRVGTVAAFGGSPYFGWDIARAIKVVFNSSGTVKGWYVLDGWGGIHRAGNVSAFSGGPYWKGWDIAKDLDVVFDSAGTANGYYVLDGFGGVHKVGNVLPASSSPYWGWNIARKVRVIRNSTGQP